MPDLDMKIFPNSLEDRAAEGGIVKAYGDFQHVQVACIDTMMQEDEDIRLDEEASFGEEENATVRRDDVDNPFIESHITKPRARV